MTLAPQLRAVATAADPSLRLVALQRVNEANKNRLMGSLLFGVQPTDGATMAAVIVTITAVAAIACWLPARRAARLDPNAVLRAD